MKCSRALRILRNEDLYTVSQRGSHLKLKHPAKKGTIVFPNHGSRELGKGLQYTLFKQAGIRD